MSCAIEPTTTEEDEKTLATHTIHSEGGSEWGEPWAVNVTFEEKRGGWLTPTQIRYEGIATYAPFSRAFEEGVMNAEEIFKKLV